MTDPVAPDSTAPSQLPGAGPAPTAKRSRSARTWIIVAIVAVVVVVGAIGAVVIVADSAAIHDGPGTATFTWTPIHQSISSGSSTLPPQPFTASINGHSVTGTATTILPNSADALSGSPSSQPVPAFRYTGQFAGQPFSLVLSFHFAGIAALTTSPTNFRITVVGTYGHMPVAAVITAPTNGPSSTGPAHLTGNIGHWKVTADIPAPTGTPTSQSATVRYVVSG
jgi:hypothetical protein